MVVVRGYNLHYKVQQGIWDRISGMRDRVHPVVAELDGLDEVAGHVAVAPAVGAQVVLLHVGAERLGSVVGQWLAFNAFAELQQGFCLVSDF